MSGASKILLVDDDASVRVVYKIALTAAGFEVFDADDGDQALEQMRTSPPDLVILDVEMPRLDGWRTLAQLRSRGHSQPVLMITRVDDVDSRVHGLDSGADDYLGKPCTAAELLARVRALLRRAARPLQPSRVLRFGNIVVDLDRKSATQDGADVALTRTEYALIEVFVRHPGKPVPRQVIAEEVWGNGSENSHTLDTHLWRLRKKLGDRTDEPRWIRNISGIGYVLTPDPAPDPA